MKLFQKITIDLYNPFPLQRIVTQQNNIGRGVIVTLTAGSVIVDPSEEDVKLWAKRPDGNVSYLSCTVQSDGTIKAPFSSQMLSMTGNIIVSLELISGEDDITTPIFIIENNVNISDHNAAESTNEFTALQQAISQMNTSMQEVEELKKEGLKGDPGIAATVRVGSVSASDPGSNPEVSNSGTDTNAILDFVIPRGIQGPKGEPPDTEDPMTATQNGVPADSLKTREEFEKKLYLSHVVDHSLATESGFAADALKVKGSISELNKNKVEYVDVIVDANIKANSMGSADIRNAIPSGYIPINAVAYSKNVTTLFQSINYYDGYWLIFINPNPYAVELFGNKFRIFLQKL